MIRIANGGVALTNEGNSRHSASFSRFDARRGGRLSAAIRVGASFRSRTLPNRSAWRRERTRRVRRARASEGWPSTTGKEVSGFQVGGLVGRRFACPREARRHPDDAGGRRLQAAGAPNLTHKLLAAVTPAPFAARSAPTTLTAATECAGQILSVGKEDGVIGVS